MRRALVMVCVIAGLCLIALSAPRAAADEIAERAKAIHFSSVVLDTHDDTTQRFFSKGFDIGKRNPDGHRRPGV